MSLRREEAGPVIPSVATEWRKWTEAEFVLNADAGGGGFTRDGKPLGFGLQTSEKTFQSYCFRVRNPGGHSSRPRPDNAIYELADALKKLQNHRFTPILTETTRQYFAARAKQEGESGLGQAMRRWLANPDDGEAADSIEANPLEVGLTRTRCVATMLKGGHAENALPQLAEATVNCRIMPGIAPPTVQQELQQAVGPTVEITPYPDLGRPTASSPLRSDILKAFTDAVRARFPNQPIIPQMSTGATDGLEFRARHARSTAWTGAGAWCRTTSGRTARTSAGSAWFASWPADRHGCPRRRPPVRHILTINMKALLSTDHLSRSPSWTSPPPTSSRARSTCSSSRR